MAIDRVDSLSALLCLRCSSLLGLRYLLGRALGGRLGRTLSGT